MAAFFREVLRLPEAVAVGASLAVLIMVNFWGNRLVFRSKGSPAVEFLRFLPTSIGARALEYALVLAFLHWTALHYLLAYTAALVTSNVFKFVLYRKFVFYRSTRATR
jgi:putative flippase GtrA